MRKILERKLRFIAKLILKKYQPEVIGITGSVGKTSAKEVIFTVLAKKFRVRKNIKNYNNEIGVPLTIIGSESGNKNIFSWIAIFFKAFRLIIFKDKSYPEKLVLEMGADHPGDIKYLVELAPCKIGIITAIGDMGPVHLEFFNNVDQLVNEKANIIKHLSREGVAILNRDDVQVFPLKEKTNAKLVTFGFSEQSDVRASDVSIADHVEMGESELITGVRFKLHYKDSMLPVVLPQVLGSHQIYAALCGAAVGITYGINLADIAEALRSYIPPAGRMRLIPGIKNTAIIDDSYNSSPVAAIAALKTLETIQIETGKHKYAVLGDMAELGKYTEEGHEKVGEYVAQVADILVTIGEKAKIIAESAKKNNMLEDRVFEFDDSESAGRFVQERLKEGDLVLVKGSQSVRTEKVVKELMAEPLRAEELLVRQGKAWQ
ncbi:MAG: UDP-N-acetylmuramoyl-tripeptide--D-alanyl-D-alanine ligase [Patescibacteria group bacterium]|jgi:UDP-N-acetylmuramoyl-tripeptide--D-alanyl-D-alanine ligase